MTFAKNKLKKVFHSAEGFAVVIAILLLLIISKNVAYHVREGILLCFNVIIGSVFPFVIITDLAVSKLTLDRIDLLKRSFEHTFKISGAALSAFICGTLCGFPLGARLADKLYSEGAISKDEFERLIGISTNSGPAFVISGIGVAMRGNLKDGIFLYSISLASSILTGIIFSHGQKYSVGSYKMQNSCFNFTESVKNATLTTLSVCGFVTVFSVITGIFNALPISEGLKLITLPFLELSNAATVFSKTKLLTDNASFIITAFAISFTGFCAHLQVKSFISSKEISMKRYYLMKLLSASFSAIIATILISIS